MLLRLVANEDIDEIGLGQEDKKSGGEDAGDDGSAQTGPNGCIAPLRLFGGVAPVGPWLLNIDSNGLGGHGT